MNIHSQNAFFTAHNGGMQSEKDAFIARLTEVLNALRYPERGRQSQLARRYGLSQPSVHKWFTGEAMPRYEIVADLCRRAMISYEWLMTGRGPKFVPPDTAQLPPEVQRVTSRLLAMEPAQRAWAARAFDAITDEPPPVSDKPRDR